MSPTLLKASTLNTIAIFAKWVGTINGTQKPEA